MKLYKFRELHIPQQLKGYGIAVCLRFAKSLRQLDEMGLELADRNHIWTLKERSTYERRVRELRGKEWVSAAYCAVILERMSTAFPHLKIERSDKAVAA